MTTDERILNHDPLSAVVAYSKVKSVLQLCDFILVKRRQSDEQFWQTFGMTLSERDEALSDLAELGQLELRFANGCVWVRMKPNIVKHFSEEE